MFMLHNSGRDTTAAAMRGVGSRRVAQESSERRNGDQVATARDIAHGVVLSTISFEATRPCEATLHNPTAADYCLPPPSCSSTPAFHVRALLAAASRRTR